MTERSGFAADFESGGQSLARICLHSLMGGFRNKSTDAKKITKKQNQKNGEYQTKLTNKRNEQTNDLIQKFRLRMNVQRNLEINSHTIEATKQQQ